MELISFHNVVALAMVVIFNTITDRKLSCQNKQKYYLVNISEWLSCSRCLLVY